MTEASVRQAGISAPLMIMRGDGGVMDISEMHRRPITTMLSGPAASVAGALMHLRISDGIYFEVGGTSTNIAVIQNGRPSITYARVGGHQTYVSSLDVRVIGIAGGSLIRVSDGRIVDVGPRSAHIAGLSYAAFANEDLIEHPKLDLFEPNSGDGNGYVSVRVASGSRLALTTTCAANVLGMVHEGVHSYGNRAAARKAFMPLADYLNVSVDEAAQSVLRHATEKILPTIQSLINDYDLDPDQRLLLGVGGGAGALVPFAASRLGIRYEIAPDAEIISSIGAALAMVREVIERIIPHPTPQDITAIRSEAISAAVRLGANEKSVEVTIEVDRQTHRVRAIAVGAAEMKSEKRKAAILESEARRLAAHSLNLAPSKLYLAVEVPGIRVYLANPEQPSAIRVIDWEGKLRVQRSRALVRKSMASDASAAINAMWDEMDGWSADPRRHPGLMLALERRVVDFSGVETKEQALALTERELESAVADEPVAIVVLPH
jgi:N-methylhydantoinase A/oxoprolinase/acetone carboxylase beta subunit